MADISLGLTFIKRLFQILKILMKFKTPAFYIFLILIPVCVLEQVAIYYMGLVPSGFYAVLENKDKTGFTHQLWISVWWIVAVVLVKCSKSFAKGAMYIQGRWNLTDYLHYNYFRNKLYYDVNCINHVIDNPDMRITQDVDKFTETIQTILTQLITFPGVVIYYTYLCWQTMGYFGPICIYSYFLISCVINKFLMAPIVRQVFELERKEGQFRYIHVNLRKLAESAAFCDAEQAEHSNFKEAIRSILDTKQRIVTQQLFLNVSISTFDYLGAILSYIILAVVVYQGTYDDAGPLGPIISKNSFYAMYLINCFSTMVDLSDDLANLAGFTHRIGQLLEFMLEHKERKMWDTKYNPSSAEAEHQDLVTLENITIMNPITKKTLVKDLSVSISHNTSVLIIGPPGSGKSSILRTIKGLWDPILGSISSSHDVIFLPQKAYFNTRSLASQITFPEAPDHQNKRIIEILHQLKIDYLLEENAEIRQIEQELLVPVEFAGLSKLPHKDWYSDLSPGEQQLVAAGRVLYHKPRLAILDEATSALSPEFSHLVYSLVKDQGTCCLSISHQRDLAMYHDKVIEVVGDGASWTIKQTSD